MNLTWNVCIPFWALSPDLVGMGAHPARYTFLLKGLKEKMPMVANRHIDWTGRGVPRDLIQYLSAVWMWGYFWETLVVVLEDWLRWSTLANVWYPDLAEDPQIRWGGSVLSLQVLATGDLTLRPLGLEKIRTHWLSALRLLVFRQASSL